MRLPRRSTDWGARFLFLAGGFIALHWLVSLWLGMQQWRTQFNETMSVSLLLRYLASPVLALQLAAVGLMFLAFSRVGRSTRRAVVGAVGLAALLALWTPGGFAHDLGHCIIHDCSSRLWMMHLVRCIAIAGAACLGLAVAEVNAFGNRLGGFEMARSAIHPESRDG